MKPNTEKVDKLMKAKKVLNMNASQAELERKRETKLLVAVRDFGDKSAFSSLYEIMRPKLLAWLYSQGIERSLGENIIQEVMITVWTRPRLFDESKSAARTWIYTLVRNKMIDEYRSSVRKKQGLSKFELLNVAEEVDSGSAEALTTQHHVSGMLDCLPVEQREILLMLYKLGMSHREVAEKLNLPIGTVKSRTRLAFQRLRRNNGASL